MLWKRSTIRDCVYKFPALYADLVLSNETLKLPVGIPSAEFKDIFDPDRCLDFETAVIGHEIIYVSDEEGILKQYCTVKDWTGPDVDPESSVEWDLPSPLEDMLERLHEMNPEALLPTGYEDAIIGYVERFGMEPQVLVDRNKCIEIMMRDGMTHDEAEEFFDFNVIGAWMGKGTPCFAVIDKSLI